MQTLAKTVIIFEEASVLLKSKRKHVQPIIPRHNCNTKIIQVIVCIIINARAPAYGHLSTSEMLHAQLFMFCKLVSICCILLVAFATISSTLCNSVKSSLHAQLLMFCRVYWLIVYSPGLICILLVRPLLIYFLQHL